jgi:protein ImuB
VRRIAAIVLPDLACELAKLDGLAGEGPFAVIVDDELVDDDDEPLDRRATLDAVDRQAWRYGARPGQSAAQASAFVGKLQVARLSPERVRRALGRVAEMALGFGTTSAHELRADAGRLLEKSSRIRYPLGAGAGPVDTVWLDVSGCARLTGGEDLLCADLRERTQALGHRARVAIADGPRIAQAIGRWDPSHRGTKNELVVPNGQAARRLSTLPVAALPLDDALTQWLLKLGILRIDDLARLDPARLAHRLGPEARDLLALIAGHDDAPLLAYQPPRRIIETAVFDHALDGSEPLLFVLRGLTSRAIARLAARGQASGRASLRLGFDRGILALGRRNRTSRNEHGGGVSYDAHQLLAIELPMPLSAEADLLRAVQAKIERLELPAPVISVELTLDDLTTKARQQLDLHRKHRADPDALPTLLAELGAWVGDRRVGVMSLVDSHRPETRSRLVPVAPELLRPRRTSHSEPDVPAIESLPEPSRILPLPIHIGKVAPGCLVTAGHDLFAIEQLIHAGRLDRVEWWSPRPVCRDYARAQLQRTTISQTDERLSPAPSHDGQRDRAEAWIYLDRLTGQGYLQGWFE